MKIKVLSSFILQDADGAGLTEEALELQGEIGCDAGLGDLLIALLLIAMETSIIRGTAAFRVAKQIKKLENNMMQ
jgi:hypothetical protein